MTKNNYEVWKVALLTVFVVALALGINYAIAATWVGPTATPPANNVAVPINVGSSSQTKSGALTVNNILTASTLDITGGALIEATGLTNALLIPSGRVGIGTLTPGRKLEVYGGAGDTFIHVDSNDGSKSGIEFAEQGFGGYGTFRWGIKQYYDGADDIFHIDPIRNSVQGTGLRMDGSGNVTVPALCLSGVCNSAWPSGGTSPWTSVSGGIKYDTGRVGIGGSPDATLKLYISGGFGVYSPSTDSIMASNLDFFNLGNIKNLKNPVNAQDAATKAYVDAQAGGLIYNANVASNAAIAGTKIAPNFGTQNVQTTGDMYGARLHLTGSYTFTNTGQPQSGTSASTAVDGIIVGQWTLCPSGSFVTGMQFVDVGSGKAAVQLQCSKFPSF